MSDPPDASTAAETRPKSHKKQVIIGLVILVPLLLFTVWWTATVMGERAIQAQLAEYRAAGQPVDAKDFRTPGIADDENNVLLLGKAADAVWLDSDDWNSFGVSNNQLIIAENMSSFDELISRNKKTFELLDKALASPAGDWELTFDGEDFDSGRLNLSSNRMLVRFFCSLSIGNHINGNDHEMIRDLLRAYDAAQITRTCPTVIGQLVATSEETLVCESLEQTVYDLQIAPAGSSEAGEGAARRKDVATLINKLLDMPSLQHLSTKAMLGERVFQLNYSRQIERGKGEPGFMQPKWVFRLIPLLAPAVKQDILISLRLFTSLSEAVGKNNYPDAVACLPPAIMVENWWDHLLHPVLGMGTGWPSRYLVLDFRNRAKRVMAGTALAIRLYEIDNDRRPAKLTDLVPDYLDAVPDDPFAKPGTPIGYLPNAPRPLLYSIEINGIDEHGQYADDPDDYPRGYDYDEPFFLNGDRPNPPPEEPEEETEEGEGGEES